MDFQILPERPDDSALIDPLLDRTFGSDRKTRTVYRLREGICPLPELSFAAVQSDGSLLASLRFWPILIEEVPAILLGPLAVEPQHQGRGIGRALVRHGLNEARRQGHRLCIVVGDPSYYRPYGFAAASPYGLVLPGPVDPPRFQVLELKPGALEGLRGLIRRAENQVEQRRTPFLTA
ncbi:MAG TPA: N-acetyltransferase [Kiloniellales bacterium]|nr:N-acetyltransferase [Kiloniellales bacterium]